MDGLWSTCTCTSTWIHSKPASTSENSASCVWTWGILTWSQFKLDRTSKASTPFVRPWRTSTLVYSEPATTSKTSAPHLWTKSTLMWNNFKLGRTSKASILVFMALEYMQRGFTLNQLQPPKPHAQASGLGVLYHGFTLEQPNLNNLTTQPPCWRRLSSWCG